MAINQPSVEAVTGGAELGFTAASVAPAINFGEVLGNIRPADVQRVSLATPTGDTSSLPAVGFGPEWADPYVTPDRVENADASTAATQEIDSKWQKLLEDPQIDRSQSDGTDGKGNPLWERKADDVSQIQVRVGHKAGDPPATYKIDADGKVHEMIPPDKLAMGSDDSNIVIELDDSAGEAVRASNSVAMAKANELIGKIKESAAYAGVAADIPDELAQMRAGEPVPPPRAVPRGSAGLGGSGMGAGAGFAGDSVPGQSNGGRFSDNSGAPMSGRAPSDGMNYAGHTSFDRSILNSPEMSAKVQSIVGSPQMADKIGQIMEKVVSKNEGRIDQITWNDNGAGASVGMFQWNQRRGELPGLMQRMAKEQPEAFRNVFGRNAEAMTNERFVRTANISPGTELGQQMQQAMNDPKLQQVQVLMAVEKVAKCAQVASDHGITSVAGVALFADLTNQLGMGDSSKGSMKYLLAAEQSGNTEASRVNALMAYSSRNGYRTQRNQAVAGQIRQGGLSMQPGSMWEGFSQNPSAADAAQPAYDG